MLDSIYFQDTYAALVKSLYYERGRGAYFRGTLVGRDYIDRVQIEGNTPEEVIENCIGFLIEKNIIEKAAYKKDESDSFFTFEIKGCVHLQAEAALEKDGVPACICPPINAILYKIRQLVDLAVEIADINVNQVEGNCIVRVVIFKQEHS